MWGRAVEFYQVPPETASAITWDLSSSDTIEQLRAIVMQASWWETFTGHLAMEKTIDVSLPCSALLLFGQLLNLAALQYLAADAITMYVGSLALAYALSD